jgi:2-C-methyl-D-erythritol 4-phosphate cytidylyltransferase
VAVPRGLERRAEGVLAGLAKPVTVVAGGTDRQASAAAALRGAEGAEAVAVHDAARPLCPSELFDVCLRELDSNEAVCVAVPSSDTIKEVAADVVVSTLDRSRLAAAQTPQAFRADVYRRAHEAAARDGVVATDDAALVERIGVAVRIIPGDARNVKITGPHDLVVAEALLRS